MRTEGPKRVNGTPVLIRRTEHVDMYTFLAGRDINRIADLWTRHIFRGVLLLLTGTAEGERICGRLTQEKFTRFFQWDDVKPPLIVDIMINHFDDLLDSAPENIPNRMLSGRMRVECLKVLMMTLLGGYVC